VLIVTIGFFSKKFFCFAWPKTNNQNSRTKIKAQSNSNEKNFPGSNSLVDEFINEVNNSYLKNKDFGDSNALDSFFYDSLEEFFVSPYFITWQKQSNFSTWKLVFQNTGHMLNFLNTYTAYLQELQFTRPVKAPFKSTHHIKPRFLGVASLRRRGRSGELTLL
jgi:hypothetical protein